jgi:hypothetical protein
MMRRLTKTVPPGYWDFVEWVGKDMYNKYMGGSSEFTPNLAHAAFIFKVEHSDLYRDIRSEFKYLSQGA